MTFTDDASRSRNVRIKHTKGEMFTTIKEQITWVKTSTGNDVAELQIDGGYEHGLTQLENYATERGIVTRITPAHTPESNGPSEFTVGYIWRMARVMALDGKIDPQYWPYVLDAVIYIINRTASRRIGNITPY